MESLQDYLVAYTRQLDERPSAGLLVERGGIHAMLNDLKAAEKDFKAAIKLDPDFAEAYNNLAGVLIRQCRFGQAEEMAEKANELKHEIDDTNWLVAMEGNRITKKIQKTPTAALYHKRGLFFYYQNLLEEAAADLKKAVELDPKLAKAYDDLGDILLKLGDLDGAEQAYDEAADMLPDFDLKQLVEVKQWKLIVKKNKLHPSAGRFNELGKLYMKLRTPKAFREAKKNFEYALELDSAFDLARANLNTVNDSLERMGLL